ncbi:MAG: SRPBCC family protein [Sphingomonas sp.]|nr:SRPBCC family protein [Sphingomonas sp.]
MRIAILTAALALAAPAAGEVKSVSAAGFEVENRVTVPAPPAEAYAALARIGQWWPSDHSWSGAAANMTLDPRAGGCFCEALPGSGGSVEHGRVVFAQPGQMLRLNAALGPLQGEAVTGTLTFAFAPAEGGGTEIVMNYLVGGLIRGPGPEGFAPIVDRVTALQLDGLRAHLTR